MQINVTCILNAQIIVTFFINVRSCLVWAYFELM